MSEIKIGNFLSPDQIANVKDNKKEELQQEKQSYFAELDMLFAMKHTMKHELEHTQFMILYNDICDNLNEVMESLSEL
jgi:hypothetical protein